MGTRQKHDWTQQRASKYICFYFTVIENSEPATVNLLSLMFVQAFRGYMVQTGAYFILTDQLCKWSQGSGKNMLLQPVNNMPNY